MVSNMNDCIWEQNIYYKEILSVVDITTICISAVLNGIFQETRWWAIACIMKRGLMEAFGMDLGLQTFGKIWMEGTGSLFTGQKSSTSEVVMQSTGKSRE